MLEIMQILPCRSYNAIRSKADRERFYAPAAWKRGAGCSTHWSSDDLKLLAKGWKAGWRTEWLASRLNRSEDAIRYKASKMGWKRSASYLNQIRADACAKGNFGGRGRRTAR